MAASSFGSVNIRVEIEVSSASSPTWERPGYVAVRHLPGSDDDVIQVLGSGGAVVTHRLLVSAAEWTSLQAAQLTENTLTIAGVSQGTCLLESLAAPEQHVDGWVTVQAQFRQVTA